MTCNAKYERPKDSGRDYSNQVEIRNYYGTPLTVRQQSNKKWNQLNSTQVTEYEVGRTFWYEATNTYENSYRSIYS